jgi:CubicO group peptidase (beta-lactamase class C family)
MKLRHLILSGLTMALTIPATSANTKTPPMCRKVEQDVKAFMATHGVPGLAFGVVKNGRIACAQGVGTTGLRTGGEVTADTNFHMASISKTFVGVSLVQLALAGKIDLDKPVVGYLPEFKLDDPRYKRITIRHMLKHRSAMPDIDDSDDDGIKGYGWDKPEHDAGALDRYVVSLSNLKLLSDPGSKFAYSNIAYEVLGAVIARVSGESFDDYVATHVLKPAGMATSSFLYPAPGAISQARPHTPDANRQQGERTDYPYNRAHGPSSTLESSVSDMNRWMIATINRNPEILPPKGWDMLWQPGPEAIDIESNGDEAPGTRMGLSYFIFSNGQANFVGHTGSDIGFTTAFMMNLKTRSGIVIMINTDASTKTGQDFMPLSELTINALNSLN